MANKQNFTPEEWTKVLESPMVVGIAVSAAEPERRMGDPQGSFREQFGAAFGKDPRRCQRTGQGSYR